MGKFIQEYKFERNVRVILAAKEFVTQLGNVTDENGERMFFGPRLKNTTRTGIGIGVEYPTSRTSILNPEPQIIAEGEQKNLYTTICNELIFNVSDRDEDNEIVEIQEQAQGLASYVWNWITPGPPNGPSDNPNGMNPQYPDVWNWNTLPRGKQDFSRNLERLTPEKTGLSGSLYVVKLFCPIIVFNPLVPWPIN